MQAAQRGAAARPAGPAVPQAAGRAAMINSFRTAQLPMLARYATAVPPGRRSISRSATAEAPAAETFTYQAEVRIGLRLDY